MRKKQYKWTCVGLVLLICSACSNYLDVVPDNVATLENAFTMRSAAEKFLFTCYSWMPLHANSGANGHLLGDELWGVYPHTPISSWKVARGEQNVVSPFLNYWDGGSGGKDMYSGIRACNFFLNNKGRVLDRGGVGRGRGREGGGKKG